MARLRCAVIGLGFGQQVHVPALRNLAHCEVVALGSTSLDKARAAALALGIERASGDWRELIDDPTIDLVTLAVPPAVQAEIAAAAISRGKAIFCEKPLAASLADAERLAQAARQANVPNLVNFEFPEDAVWRRSLRMVQDGAIGRVRHVAVEWRVLTYANRMRLDSWKSHTTAGGGALGGFASHVFDYLERFAGSINSLQARLHRESDDPRPGETLVELWLEFDSGAVGTVSANTDAGPGNSHRVSLFGSAGGLELVSTATDYLRGFRMRHGTRANSRELHDVVVPEATEAAAGDGRIAATSRLLSRLVDWRLGGPATGPTFAQGARVQRLIEAARQSAASGLRVATT